MLEFGKVAVLDEDPWRRRGLAAAVLGLGGLFDDAASADPTSEDAVELAADASTLVLVGPASADRWDRWAVLTTLARIVAACPADERRVILLAADTNPLVPLRALEVGVHAVLDLIDVNDPQQLEWGLLTPPSDRHPALCADRRALRRLGLSLASTPEAFLRRAAVEGVRTGGPAAGMSRRQAITVRSRLTVSLGADGGGDLGSWRHLNHLAALARGHG